MVKFQLRLRAGFGRLENDMMFGIRSTGFGVRNEMGLKHENEEVSDHSNPTAPKNESRN